LAASNVNVRDVQERDAGQADAAPR
jgi:hypothetical protein